MSRTVSPTGKLDFGALDRVPLFDFAGAMWATELGDAVTHRWFVSHDPKAQQ